MARKKEFNPQKALDKAMQIFWLKGYVATSMDDLCTAMGIKRGSLYDTFGDKRSLFINSIDLYVQTRDASFECIKELESPLHAIVEMFHFAIDQVINDPDHRGCFLVNTLTELASVDPEIAKIAEHEGANHKKLFYELLVSAEAAGEIRSDQDLHDKAEFLINALYGLMVYSKINQDRVVLENIVKTTISVVK